ncbi:hypothetical protein H4219_002959 [Mycoemilia scoparia]|uniref:Uncharacterized protein n=1 Tax=Mycoemilia scoparia TaxID=417184 RepID=A0A9W8DTN6_9FUNG|nr:hypothetical protein H4219_002959 [Mycoemilia scoparia]
MDKPPRLESLPPLIKLLRNNASNRYSYEGLSAFSKFFNAKYTVDYYLNKKVYRSKRPRITSTPYPNKIDLDATSTKYYTIVSRNKLRLKEILIWMSNHPYIHVNVHLHGYINCLHPSTNDPLHYTGKFVVEAYDSPSRSYSMLIFRPARRRDEIPGYIIPLQPSNSDGDEQNRPHTALICAPGSSLRSIWQWLALHNGKFADVSEEPAVGNNIVLVANPRRVRVEHTIREVRTRSVPGEQYIPGEASANSTSIYPPMAFGQTHDRPTRAAPNPGNVYYDLAGRRLNAFGQNRNGSTLGSGLRRRNSIDSLASTLPPYEPRQLAEQSAPIGSNVGGDLLPGQRSLEIGGSSSQDPPPPSYWQIASLTEYGRSWSARNPAEIHSSGEAIIVDGDSNNGDSSHACPSHCRNHGQRERCSRLSLTQSTPLISAEQAMRASDRQPPRPDHHQRHATRLQSHSRTGSQSSAYTNSDTEVQIRSPRTRSRRPRIAAFFSSKISKQRGSASQKSDS